MKQEFEISGKVTAVNLERTEEGYSAKIGEESYQIKIKKTERGVMLLDVNEERFKVFIGENGGRYSVSVRGEEHTVQRATQDTSQTASVMGEKKEGNSVTAPMPGKVIKILCAEGEKVKTGQTLAIIEAMKMENNINAHRDALIKRIVAKEGDQVNLSDPIMEFESEEND